MTQQILALLAVCAWITACSSSGASPAGPLGQTGGSGANAAVTAGTSSGGDSSTAGRDTSGAGGSGPSVSGAAGSSVGSVGGASGTPVVIPGAGHCTAPTMARASDADAAYQKWKTDLVTSEGAGGFLRVRRPNSNAQINSTVSEGIGYGMLLAVYAGDQPTFDKLWQYSQLWLDGNGLMNWYINAEGTDTLGTGAASDADEDIAFALVMADARWGGSGSLGTSYSALAKQLIGLIWQYEVDHTRADVLMPGDSFGDGSIINISYFAPAYYRVFGRFTGDSARWEAVATTSYAVIERTLNAQNGNSSNGLVPAWSTPEGVPSAPAGQTQTFHQLDSCRTPFRIAQDYCWFGEPRAQAYLQKISGFYATIGASAMVDGYELDGTPHTQSVTNGGPRAASFVGPAGVAAMATGGAFSTLRDEAYANIATLNQLAGSTYYQESWTALSLQMMTGTLRDLGSP
ncbi:MAG: glycosyl hydrolase family 8 [Myxococcales bacterium]